MAGDVEIHEELVLGQAADESAAASLASAAEQANAHVLHSYGPRVAVAQLDPTDTPVLAHALPGDMKVAPARITKSARQKLSDSEQLGLAAFELRVSDEYAQAKAERPLPGAAWDGADGASAPGCAELATAPAQAPTDEALSHVGVPLSARLSGSVAVGLVLVEGPTAALQFDATDRTKVVAETQNGATWLGGRHPVQPVTWSWDIDVIRVDASADPNAADLEARWRDPAMAALGYGSGLAGVRAYAEDLRRQLGTDWAYITFFTKYPTGWFAYASIGGPRLVMQYDNDGWGPDNIDRVFAHETGHIFNAPDEYASSNCSCGGAWGYYGKPNTNCASCAAGGGVACIMKANTWDMCPSTPYHLGFPICPGRLGVQFRGNVPASSTRRWFTHSWPADCHVVWSVVPTTVRAGAAQIRWDVHVERASTGYITYWISVTNITTAQCEVEARYAVLGST
ncbi:MAG TPA: hypothetical protein VFH30_02115 [Acidimicrobiales bacterium]|nr:hypothetical protein [Acidimicrobiales bacterium]